jgi:hypothetical protein
MVARFVYFVNMNNALVLSNDLGDPSPTDVVAFSGVVPTAMIRI